MKTLALLDKDLQITNHNFVKLNDRETLKQRIFNRLNLFLGEFELEPNAGVDWFELKEQKYNTKEIEKAISDEILRDDEVRNINSIEVIYIDSIEKVQEYKRPQRSLLIQFNLNTVYGILDGQL